MNGFKKAERKKIKLKLAVTGPTGSGKTYSSLVLAHSLGKKIAVIDSENGSASLYSDKFEFDTLVIEPPFTTEKYIDAINLSVKEGYDVVVIDSITHAWAGEGGLLQQKEQLDARGGNSFVHWGKITAKQEVFKSVLLNSDIHVIATMRSKMEYAQIEENGKKKIQKLGLAPQQRDGIEYDFSIVFDIAMNHEAEASKDRTGLFTDKIFKITDQTGKIILKWLEGAKDEPNQQAKIQGSIGSASQNPVNGTRLEKNVQPSPVAPIQSTPLQDKVPNFAPVNQEQIKDLLAASAEVMGYDEPTVREKVRAKYGRALEGISVAQWADLMDIISQVNKEQQEDLR